MSQSENAERIESASALVRALLEDTAAQVGPAIGVELEVGDPEVAEETEVPEGELAVLGIEIRRDDATLGHIEIVSALSEIVCLSRRMAGIEEPDAKEEIGDEDLEPIGELLKLMAAGVEEASRATLEGELAFVPGDWWRADEPGEHVFAPGPCIVGAAPFTVPGGPTANLFFRIGAALLASGEAQAEVEAPKAILLLDLDDELRESLSAALASTGKPVEAVSSENEEIELRYPKADAIFLSNANEGVLALCRRLRQASETWRVPLVLCAAEPTQDLVVRALTDGVSHVLCVPAAGPAVARVLKAARPIEG